MSTERKFQPGDPVVMVPHEPTPVETYVGRPLIIGERAHFNTEQDRALTVHNDGSRMPLGNVGEWVYAVVCEDDGKNFAAAERVLRPRQPPDGIADWGDVERVTGWRPREVNMLDRIQRMFRKVSAE